MSPDHMLAGLLVCAAVLTTGRARAASARAAVAQRLGGGSGPPGAGSLGEAGRGDRWLDRALDAAAIDVASRPVRRRWGVAVALAGLIGVVALGWLGGVVFGVVVGAAPIAWLWMMRNRRDAAIERELPDALDAMARSLRSGLSLGRAVAESAVHSGPAVARDLREVSARVERGQPLGDALGAWARWRPTAGVRLVAAALTLAARAGGAQARAVDGVAATVRDRLVADGEAHALSSQARASALLVAALPVVFLAVAAAADPESARTLFTTRFGLGCLVAGVALDAVALVWMHRLTRDQP